VTDLIVLVADQIWIRSDVVCDSGSDQR